jgi:hypothetical protein
VAVEVVEKEEADEDIDPDEEEEVRNDGMEDDPCTLDTEDARGPTILEREADEADETWMRGGGERGSVSGARGGGGGGGEEGMDGEGETSTQTGRGMMKVRSRE